VESSAGRIFVSVYVPSNIERCAIYVPPFAEEMNKFRRQLAETSRALVSIGCAVIVVDLFGTGDSDGDFRDATWDIWKSDVVTAINWAEDHVGAVDAVIAARLGCSLASESVQEARMQVRHTVFWQPVTSGRQFMTQFLRLQVAASMMESGAQVTVEALRTKLEAVTALEVAGYELSPDLWRSVEDVDLLSSLHRGLGDLHIVEVGRSRQDGLSVSGQRLMSEAQEQGLGVSGQRVPGDPMWSATEIVTNPLLQEATVAHLA